MCKDCSETQFQVIPCYGRRAEGVFGQQGEISFLEIFLFCISKLKHRMCRGIVVTWLLSNCFCKGPLCCQFCCSVKSDSRQAGQETQLLCGTPRAITVLKRVCRWWLLGQEGRSSASGTGQLWSRLADMAAEAHMNWVRGCRFRRRALFPELFTFARGHKTWLSLKMKVWI